MPHRQLSDEADLQQAWHREAETRLRKTTLGPGPSQHEGLGSETNRHFAEHVGHRHKTLGKGHLYALMCWCNVFTKEGVPFPEEEAAKAKEAHYNKASVMKVAKLIQRVVLLGGLEQASGELVPFRMDLETVEVYAPRSWTSIYITIMLIFIVVIAVLYYLHKIIRDLRGQFAQLRAELRE